MMEVGSSKSLVPIYQRALGDKGRQFSIEDGRLMAEQVTENKSQVCSLASVRIPED